MRNLFVICIVSILFFTNCSTPNADNAATEEAKAITPVSVVLPDTSAIKDEITLNAIAAYLLKTDVKANINGYITKSNILAGSKVRQGQTLFVLETKEARSLGNTINNLDPSFNFSGINRVKSPVTGYVTMLNHQAGDYVQDGETLATISDKSSFGFMLNLPYEDRQLLNRNKSITLLLPDSTVLQGYVSQIMPQADSFSQTQKVLVKIQGIHNIPENLIAKAILVKSISTHISMPKSAVFSDDSQQDFWVMKLINDSMAVKVKIKKGLEDNNQIEIISPQFSQTDRFVSEGGYGLADTAKISIQK